MFIAPPIAFIQFREMKCMHFISREDKRRTNSFSIDISLLADRNHVRGCDCRPKSSNAVGCLRLAEEILAGLFGDEAGEFQFVVSALNLTFIDREFLREGRGRGQRLAGGYGLVFDVGFDLFAHLRVHGAFG